MECEYLGIATRERRTEGCDPAGSFLGEGGGQFVEKLTVAADAGEQGVNVEKRLSLGHGAGDRLLFTALSSAASIRARPFGVDGSW